ncbi:hypothetical protein ALC56_06300, partial [Trachymyrmex septentrionalis]
SKIFNLLNNLQVLAKKQSLDFDTPGILNDVDYYRLTGISVRNFVNLFTYVTDKIRSISIKSTRTCLELFEGKDVAILVADAIYLYMDSITTLEEYGLISKMLHFLKQEGNMLSVNKFRLVIKICWIVKSINGLIKTWKMLANVFSNIQINDLQKIVEDERWFRKTTILEKIQATSRDFSRLTFLGAEKRAAIAAVDIENMEAENAVVAEDAVAEE